METWERMPSWISGRIKFTVHLACRSYECTTPVDVSSCFAAYPTKDIISHTWSVKNVIATTHNSILKVMSVKVEDAIRETPELPRKMDRFLHLDSGNIGMSALRSAWSLPMSHRCSLLRSQTTGVIHTESNTLEWMTSSSHGQNNAWNCIRKSRTSIQLCQKGCLNAYSRSLRVKRSPYLCKRSVRCPVTLPLTPELPL